MKSIESNFLVLEIKPNDSTHPQGNRVLECVEFTPHSFKIKGTPRFEKFRAIFSMPQDGSKLESEVEVINTAVDYFNIKLINPSEAVVSKISWWFAKDVEFLEATKPTKKSVPDLDTSA